MMFLRPQINSVGFSLQAKPPSPASMTRPLAIGALPAPSPARPPRGVRALAAAAVSAACACRPPPPPPPPPPLARRRDDEP